MVDGWSKVTRDRLTDRAASVGGRAVKLVAQQGRSQVKLPSGPRQAQTTSPPVRTLLANRGDSDPGRRRRGHVARGTVELGRMVRTVHRFAYYYYRLP